MNLQSLIDEAIADGKEDKEQNSWYSSALGQCLTRTYLERKGVTKAEFDERVLRIFTVGNIFEDWIAEIVAKKAKVETQVSAVWEAMDLRGRVDLMVDGMPYELKTKHSNSFWKKDWQGKSYLPNRHHEMQLWTYLKSLDKEEGRLVYVSKDDLAIAEFVVRQDDKQLAEETTKELELLNRAWQEQLPPPPIMDKKDWRYKYCPVHQSHCLNQPKYLTAWIFNTQNMKCQRGAIF